MRAKAFISLALLAMPAMASDYLSVPFTYGIPATFTIMNADGMQLRENIYSNNIDLSKAWSACRLSGGHGYTALSPTRSVDTSKSEENVMTLPAVTVSNASAMIVWDAKSLHKNIRESYRIEARCVGDTEWKTIYDCREESHRWTTRCVPLAEFEGNDVELAIVATTRQGFILAIDNIEVGVPKSQRLVFGNKTSHFVDNKGDIHISGTIANFGATVNWSGVELVFDGKVAGQAGIGTLSCGEAADIGFAVAPEIGTHEYAINAIDGDKRIELCKDNIQCSYAKRTVLIDKCTGTWCNNCPKGSLTIAELQDLYGDEMVIIENHIKDAFANDDYDYTGGFVFGIPELVANHNPASIGGVDADGFINELRTPTIFSIEATAEEEAVGVVKVHSRVNVAGMIDNSSDRYRIGYVLLADLHTDNLAADYVQQSQATNYFWEQYYYMQPYILPELMFYENVPVAVLSSSDGTPGSLGDALDTNGIYEHDCVFQVPTGLEMDTRLSVVAMVVDSATGLIQNCCHVELYSDSPGGIDMHGDDVDGNAPAVFYNLQGFRVTNPTKGVYVKRKGNTSRKVLFK